MNSYLFIITITLFALLSISLVYGEGNVNNSIQQNSTFTATNKILDYRFEPFLILNGKDFEDISHNNNLSFENFAISTWIKTNQTNLVEPAHIVNKGGFNTDKKGENMNYGIWFSTDGTIVGGFETESGEDFEVKSTSKYNDGKWHYVLLSYDGSLLRLDIDGEKQISTIKNTNGAIPDTTGEQPLRIGANSLDESKFFTGNIDEVRIWDRGLTDKEISEIYTKNTFESKGQIVYWDFRGDRSAGLYRDTSDDVIDNAATVEEEQEDLFSQSPRQNITDKVRTEQGVTPSNNITNTIKGFNIAVSADWGCEKDTIKTAENIQKKNPELVIAAGDLSYKKSAGCWFEIIQPFKSKMKISMGDHEYSDTSGGAIGVINQYLKPLNLTKTYYSFDMNNVHFVFIDPYIDYSSGSSQYQFIEHDLKTASTNPKINWIFVVQHTPMYTSPSKHLGDSTIRDTFHPLFDKYNVDLVFGGDNHNYPRTFPLQYNDNADSSNPIIADRNQTNSNIDYSGQIYLIIGTAGKSHYDIQQRASFIANQNDDQYGFLNIDINANSISMTGTFYSNGNDDTLGNNNIKNNILDQFTISKMN